MVRVLELNEHLRRHLSEGEAFDRLMRVEGVVHRQVKNRRTLDFTFEGRHYFIKIHHGCGWGGILKDLFQARWPVVSARTEWEAIERLAALGIATLSLAGKGLRGWNPARLESFVITDALAGTISLETLVKDWGGLTGPARRRLQDALVDRLAEVARRMHAGGVNHRDFYLCHFLVQDRDWKRWQPGDPLDLVLIDLHRVQRRGRVPRRWVIKDLASLLCSAYEWGVRRRDLARFVRAYGGQPWRSLNATQRRFWRSVWRRAYHLFAGFYRRLPPPM